MAGIGMGVMHDAIHGSHSKHRWFNKLMAATINLIGSNQEMWRLQHNVLHHTFTNIEDHDHDISAPFFLRFSPHAKKNKLHRFQHLYAWIFYGFMTISWITVRDFTNLAKFNSIGLIPNRKSYRKYLFQIILGKVVFYSIVLTMPLLFSSVSGWAIVGAFMVMQFVTGLCIAIVFQAAHVMPDMEFPLPDENGSIESQRLEHQLHTTSNFAQKDPILFWFLGGLTNQIEHHLFPNISHIHYKKIAPIVKQTAQEFGLPYHSNGSFIATVFKHFRMLKDLGRIEMVK